MSDEKVFVTQEGYEELKNELSRLIHEERKVVINELQEARAQGDLSENADYDAARDHQARVEARIREVEEMIKKGSLVLLPMSDIRGYDTSGMNAAIYISEAQNLDIELMRLALQRVGEDSICILDGDSNAQVDLSMYAGDSNGMRRVSNIFKGADFYGEVTLVNIHRSKIAELAQLL